MVSSSFLLFLASTASAAVLESLNAVPAGWQYSGAAKMDEPIRLQIALKQGDVEKFEQAVIDMSTPDHPTYGQHFQDHEEMKRMLLPSETTLSTVQKWLKTGGVSNVEVDSDWVNVRTTVGVANELLSTKFEWYTSEAFGKRLRTLEYSVPDEVAGEVLTIQPTVRFGQGIPEHATHHAIDEANIMSLSAAAANTTNCNKYITPQCLQSLYKIDYKPDAKSGSKVAFNSYLEESARYSDLSLFISNIAPYAAGENYTVITFEGGVDDQTSSADSGEANLDGQYIVGIAAPLPVTEYITAGRGELVPDLTQPDPANNGNEPYLAFLQDVLKRPQHELPQVMSTSYGEGEQSVPEKYAKSVCNLYAQLGSRGVSVIFSSGDSGVGSACQTNDGKNTTRFEPQFPASCPWVTSVGGTQYLDEEATFFSSGGFSNYWSRPIWQTLAVEGYLAKLGKKFAPYFNRYGRGFPDVAAQSVGYAVYDKGKLGHFEGTSASTPAFAAIVALLNDARLRNNLPPMGFLNPWVYTVGPAVLNDIQKGGSTGCDGLSRFHGDPNGSPVIPYASWNATKGWDPVTGWGTPNFPKMLKAAVPFRYRA
ncbi:Tripeptidyl-peptidase sed2 [Paraphaeosphaeria sporulosa]